MRTVKRVSEQINSAKMILLEDLCRAYAREKRYWLDVFRSWSIQAELQSYRRVRDELVHSEYISIYGLQARQWKLALQDAMGVWDKYWQSIFVQARKKIASTFCLENMRHYAFWLLCGYEQFSACMKGKALTAPFDFSSKEAEKVSKIVQRIIRKLMKKSPSIRKMNSIKLDADCYEVFEEKGRQYIKVMSLQKGKRIVIPLLGKATIQGNITLLIKEGYVEIHVAHEIHQPSCVKTDIMEAVDFGFTEVMVDQTGVCYGTNLGSILSRASDKLSDKMKQRNRLHAICKKSRKIQRLKKFNLGKKKLQAWKKKVKACISKEINTAIHKLVDIKKPSLLITEDLSHRFSYNKSKRINRRLSSWVRGEIQNRVSFKALVKGFHHEQVNPAYGSQTCLLCDFVDSRNRTGDVFKCLHCKHEDIADRVAAMNYARRYGDPKISLGMPPRQVRFILLDKFFRRLEKEQSLTVPGKTAETVSEEYPPPLSKKTIAEREQSRKDRTVPRRAKQNQYEHICAHF